MCAAVLGAGIYNSPGPSASNPSIIRNCEFLNLWRLTGPTGVGIEIANSNPANSNWLIQENTFNSTRQGVFVNQNSRITITQNSFTRCVHLKPLKNTLCVKIWFLQRCPDPA
jgi:hypothetical protein